MITQKTVVVINDFGMGKGESTLTLKLVNTYLNMLDLGETLPMAICLYAEGVKLACNGSPVLDEFNSLVAKGVRLIVCTTQIVSTPPASVVKTVPDDSDASPAG